jgi:hypothetical protein
LKDTLEAVLAALKIIGIFLTVMVVFIFVFYPKTVARQIETIGTELRELEDSVEYSLFFVKVKTEGTAKEDLVKAEKDVEKLNSALLGAKCIIENKGACADADIQAAKAIIEVISIQEGILIGQGSKVSVSEAWVVLASSLPTLDAAFNSAKSLEREDLQYEIIHAANRFRLAAVFDNQETAHDAVAKVNGAIARTDSYVRFLPSWCDDHKRVEDGDRKYLSCDRSVQLAKKP